MDISSFKADIAAFADPVSPVSSSGDTITWSQEGTTRSCRLVSRDNELPDIEVDGRRYSYREFFASDLMGSLLSLANSIQRVLPASPGYVGKNFVEPRAQDDDDQISRKWGDLLTSFDPADTSRRTQLVFLRGRAGDGKSAVLMRTAVEQAERYLRGEAEHLFLYINAQSSSLARIDEVMAKVTQDMRARFTYQAISTLTRLGLLVPVIDGFDELLGVGGYKDAFSSLAFFVSRLRGQGVLIASARSTFYQYTNFRKEAERFDSEEYPLYFDIRPLTLLPWGEPEDAAYLAAVQSGLTTSDLREQLGARAEEILSSPFLLSQVIGLGLSSDNKAPIGNVIQAIVRELLTREMRKLTDPQEKPLLTLAQHERFVSLIAEEMWWQEKRELDERSYTTVAELLCEEIGLEGLSKTRVLGRVPAYGLFERRESPPRMAFRHEFYFAYFLGRLAVGMIEQGPNIKQFLSRGTLSPVVGEEIALALLEKGLVSRNISTLLPSATGALGDSEVIANNRGTIVGAAIAVAGERINEAEISNCVFEGLTFRGSRLEGATFASCSFAQCDFRGAAWLAVRFVDSPLFAPLVSADTKLTNSRIDIRGGLHGLRIAKGHSNQDVEYSLYRISEYLKGLGALVEGPVVTEVARSAIGNEFVALLEDFLRVPEKSLYFSDNDFAHRGGSLQGKFRPVFDLLRKHHLLVNAAQKARRGTRAMYRMTVLPVEMLEGLAGRYETADIKAFWSDVNSL